MKKFALLITFLLVALVVGGYYYYHSFLKRTPVSALDLVPAETVMLYEFSNCKSCFEDVKKSPVREIIRKSVSGIRAADSLTVLRNYISDFFYPALVSLHITKKDECDFMFYLPLNKQNQQKLDLALEHVTKINGVKTLTRTLNDNAIYEVMHGESIFSYVIIDNVLVASFTPVLVEDVIRTHSTKEVKNFKALVGEVYKLPTIKNDAGNLYINLRAFANLVDLFTNTDVDPILKQLGQASVLDVKTNEGNKIVLNGFSVTSSNSPDYVLSAFKDQSPVPFALKNYIPNNALMVASYGISNGTALVDGISTLRTVRNDSLSIIAKSAGVDFAKLFDNFYGEIGVAWFEGRNESINKVLLIQNQNGIDAWENVFEKIAAKLSIDTVFYETYADFEIREVPVFRFPEKLFQPIIKGFDFSFYTSTGNTIILADDINNLKTFLNEINREDTWGKSVEQNRFLESTLLESNISLFINTPKALNIFTESLKTKWRKRFEEIDAIQHLGKGAIQFSHLNESYYSNFLWNFEEGKRKNPSRGNNYVLSLEAGVHRMASVKNHIDRSDEIVLQDSSFQFMLLGMDGKIQWKIKLDDFVASDITQIDVLKNGKLQYFFATPGKLHVIDRLGNYVSPYPIAIGEQQIDFTSIVDYDNSKNYRFLISGKEGKLWMYDKEGNNLDGWKPRLVDEQLASPARHHRILGKDYIIAVRQDGVVFLMNRRGEIAKGFPLDLNARVSGDYYVEIGKNKSSTFIVVVTKDGHRIRFTLDGRIHSNEVLVKNSLQSEFVLVTERDMKSYLIMRREQKQLTLYDEKLSEIIKSDFIGNNPVKVSYEQNGLGRNYITLTDLSQDLSFVYNDKGLLLTPIPIDSHGVLVKPLEGKGEKLFYYQSNTVTISTTP